MSGIYTRFPCSANKHACPICRVRQGQSFHLDEAASVLRVAHVPQKPWYVILGTIAVGFGGSAFALRLGFSAVVSIPAKAGETLQKVCPSIRCANWDQNHSETLHKEFSLFSPKTGTTPLIKTSPARLNVKQKKSCFLKIFDFIARKNYRAICLLID